MKQEWSLIKDGEIVKTITNGVSGGKRNLVDGRSSANHPEEWLIDSGYLPHINPDVETFEVLGNQVILPDKITNEVRSMGQEEIDNYWSKRRQQISSMISSIAERQSETLRQGYSVTETSRWSRDQLAVESGNWSRFDRRAGATMTGQQYAETRVIPKMEAGDIFMDKVIAKRTDLIAALGNTLDEDLDSFDYTSTWDEETDYVPPPVEEVSESGWAALMNSISWNIKLL